MKNKIMLERFEQRFIEIESGKDPIRTKRLAVLMTDMEGTFHIPMIRRDSFIEANKEVMDLFLKVSKARDLEGVS